MHPTPLTVLGSSLNSPGQCWGGGLGSPQHPTNVRTPSSHTTFLISSSARSPILQVFSPEPTPQGQEEMVHSLKILWVVHPEYSCVIHVMIQRPQGISPLGSPLCHRVLLYKYPWINRAVSLVNEGGAAWQRGKTGLSDMTDMGSFQFCNLG